MLGELEFFMDLNKKLNFEVNDEIYDYKLFDTLKAIKLNKSQRKAAKSLGISHTVLNRRILKAEAQLSEQLVISTNKGSNLTEFARDLLDNYESYENRLNDDGDLITFAGGFISAEFIRELAVAYQVDNLRILQTDLNSAYDLANRGFIDILGFDDPVQAYIYDIEPTPLGRDSLMLLSHDNKEFNTMDDLNSLKFVEVENSAQRLAWNTLADYDLDFDIVSSVGSFHEAIRLVEQNDNLHTFINKSISYTYMNVSDVLYEQTRHIISALNVKNDTSIDKFLNYASHRAQKLTEKYGFEHI